MPLRFLAVPLCALSLLAADAASAQTFTVGSLSASEGNAGSTIITFNVTRDVTTDAASVDVATMNGTAVAPGDYVAVGTTTLSFAIGVNLQTVDVTVNGDTTVELNEVFNVVLSNQTPGYSTQNGTGTITNDDSAVFSRGTGFQTTEGNVGTTPANFTVILSAPVDVAVTVDIQTQDLVATVADGDYQAASGTLTFPANSPANTSQTFPVSVNGDTKVEFNQRFATTILNVQSQGRDVQLPPLQGQRDQTTNIINDDQGRIVVNDPLPLAEGTGAGTTALTFNIVLLDAAEIPSGQTLSVNATTANGTATTADGDYAAAGPSTRAFVGTLNETQTFTVQVGRDAKVELNENFLVNLANLVLPTSAVPGACTPPPVPPALCTMNVIILDAQATGMINNDDSATLSISNVSASEMNTGSTPTFTFTVTLNAQVDVPLTVDFATADGTATTADSDYITTNGILNFAGTTAGETKSVPVTVNGDDKVELTEVFRVTLSNIAASTRNVGFGLNPGFGTIVNDETATLSINDVTLVEGGAPGTTPFNFTVALDRQLANPMSVDFDAVDDTATAADDFAVTPGTLNFAGTQNEVVPLSVNVNGDSKAERNEVFRVVLSNLQAGGLETLINISDQGLGTINNDDSMDLSITKGDGGANSFPGGPILYQLSYQNLGPGDAGGVVLTDVVPPNTTFDPSSPSATGWSCTPNNNPGSSCTLGVGTVLAGGSASRNFPLNVSSSLAAPATITNTASISDETAGVADTSSANNSEPEITEIVEFAPTDFFTLPPCRVIDTRTANGPALAAGADRVFPVVGACGIPASAKAISVTFQVTASTAGGNVRIHPGGSPVPMISSLNYSTGQTRSNNAIVSLNSAGEIAVFASQPSGTVDFLLDVNGYFE